MITLEQKTAILHRDGPMMVFAGPGSGKTTVITHRVKQLIEGYRIPASNILVITFSRSAAKEMKSRFEKLCPERYPVIFGTFHSVFFSILKHSLGYHSSNILREDEKRAFFREMIDRYHLERDDEADLIRMLSAEISREKTQSQRTGPPSQICAPHVFQSVYSAYSLYLKKEKKLDFDDMLLVCRGLFLDHPDILQSWQALFRYILIDEFQDISPLQYEIIRMLAAPQDHLFIVGDDDQSIYRFRGATPQIWDRFRQDFPQAKHVTLSLNFRSAPEIVRVSSALIAGNPERSPKDMHSAIHEKGEVSYRSFPDAREQNQWISHFLRQYHADGKPLHDVAVLYRTNAQSRILTDLLSAQAIPFRAKDRVPCIYDAQAAKDIFAYLRIAAGSEKREDFLRIINRPMRYISRDVLKNTVSFADFYTYYSNASRMKQRIRKLEGDIEVLSRMRPYSAVNYIRLAVGYDDYIRDYAKDRQIPAEPFFEILDALQEKARDYVSFSDWEEYICRIKKEQSVQNPAAGAKGVVIATYHAAKGLEFDTVILPDTAEGMTPYKKSRLAEELEEERRMFYVAMTRAKKNLYLLYPRKIGNKEYPPSHFLTEISGVLG